MKWKRLLLVFAGSEVLIVLLAWLLTVRSSRLAFNRSLFVVAAIAAGLALIAVAGSGMAGGPLRISVGTGAAGNSLGYLTALSADPKGIQEAFRQERERGR